MSSLEINGDFAVLKRRQSRHCLELISHQHLQLHVRADVMKGKCMYF